MASLLIHSYVFLLCTFLFLDRSFFVSSKRILMVPFLNTSHTIILHAVASRLAARGHSVTVLWAREFTQAAITRHPNFTLLEFSTRMKSEELAGSFRMMQDNVANPPNVSIPLETGWLTKLNNYIKIGSSLMKLGESVSLLGNAICKTVLSDNHLMKRLREQQFDIALVDDFYLTRCLFLIPHSLGAPYKYLLIQLLLMSRLKFYCTFHCILGRHSICFSGRISLLVGHAAPACPRGLVWYGVVHSARWPLFSQTYNTRIDYSAKYCTANTRLPILLSRKLTTRQR